MKLFYHILFYAPINCEYIIYLLILCSIGLAQISENLNSIPKLNGSNFKIWKESLEILLGCMDLDLALRNDELASTKEQLNASNIKKEKRSNRMCLMIIRPSIPVFLGFYH